MSEWQDKSDFEINKLVAKKLGYRVVDGFQWEKDQCWVKVDKEKQHSKIFDYCGDANDAWPIILENGICTNAMAGGDFTLWYAHDKYHTNVDSAVYDENPLRAAMIVYLEMNGVKP